jgi:hypothetical protein
MQTVPYSSIASLLLSIYHGNGMRRALSVGPDRGSCSLQGSCAPNSGALWLAMVPPPLCSRRLPYETAKVRLDLRRRESWKAAAAVEDKG